MYQNNILWIGMFYHIDQCKVYIYLYIWEKYSFFKQLIKRTHRVDFMINWKTRKNYRRNHLIFSRFLKQTFHTYQIIIDIAHSCMSVHKNAHTLLHTSIRPRSDMSETLLYGKVFPFFCIIHPHKILTY